MGKICKHCGYDIAIRNPSGYCDHLYYPENCEICKKNEGKVSLAEQLIAKVDKLKAEMEVLREIVKEL